MLAAACGRVGFDGRAGDAGDGGAVSDVRPPCTAVGHDEDVDGVDDGCDVCPHLADPGQADGDGDGVGDACDPEPTMPRQQIVLFDPFTTFDPAWMHHDDEHTAGDQLVLDGSAGARRAFRTWVSKHELFIIHGTTGAQVGGVGQLALFVGELQGAGLYYCELYDTGATALQFTYTYDGNTFHAGGPGIDAANRVQNGTGMMTFETSTASSGCTSTWHDEPLSTSGPTPTGITPELFEIYADGFDTKIDYVIDIRTND